MGCVGPLGYDVGKQWHWLVARQEYLLLVSFVAPRVEDALHVFEVRSSLLLYVPGLSADVVGVDSVGASNEDPLPLLLLKGS